MPRTLISCLRLVALLFVTTFLPTMTACGLGGPAYKPASASGAVAAVDMTDRLSFDPSVVRIRAGQTVAWRNQSIFTHTVTDDPARAKDAADAQLPAGAEAFSARVAPGEVYRHAFTVPGTYRYFCMPHESWGMHGEVIVAPES